MRKYSEYKYSGVKWIGDIPKHWDIKRLGLFFTENRTINSDMQCTEAYKFNYGTLIRKDEDIDPNELKDTYSKYTALKPRDIVINGLNLNYDFVSQRVALATSNGIITSAYIVISPRTKVNELFFYYLLKSMDEMKLFHGMGSGIRLTLSFKDLKYQLIPIPPLAEQRAIVSYLDSKVGQIDTYVAKQTQQIELLKELKQAVIANAVTKGIDNKAKLKQTGISWIGHVPQHWERCRCKDVLTEIKLLVGNGEYALLSLTTNGVIVRDLSEGKGKFPKDFNTYKVVKPNDLVFCLFDVDETPRTVGLVHNHGMLTGAYNVFETKNVDTSFLYHYFIALDNRKALKPLYKGLRKVIPLPAFMSMPLYIPPLSEQRAIVSYIEAKTASINKLIDAYEQQVERVKEYKQRLISDAVTGKMNVTDEQTQTN